MMHHLRWLTPAAALLIATAALAHGPNQPPHQLYKMGDLSFKSGEVIKDLAISYVTHGTLNANKSNAILMVTALRSRHRPNAGLTHFESRGD